MKRFLDALALENTIEIVDVGAANLEHGSKAPYLPLIEAKAARVTGFEPNPAEFSKLPQTETCRYLPYAAGDGQNATLYITQSPGFCSTLKPDMKVANLIKGFASNMIVKDTLDISTCRLDDMEEIQDIDFLKIDIQGGEVAVFEGGAAKLQTALAIQTEVAFWPFYEKQPSFADQNKSLERLGFQFFGMHSVNRFSFDAPTKRYRRSLAMHLRGQERKRDIGPWGDGDAIYLRRYELWDNMNSESVKRMIALLGAICTASNAIAYLCKILTVRGDMASEQANYIMGHMARQQVKPDT